MIAAAIRRDHFFSAAAGVASTRSAAAVAIARSGARWFRFGGAEDGGAGEDAEAETGGDPRVQAGEEQQGEDERERAAEEHGADASPAERGGDAIVRDRRQHAGEDAER